ncbi:MAG: hypothetical protein J1E02_01835, partial [Coprobacter sp.]|nr:hypothetical protein [Coprobacter sp.]
MTVQNLYLFNPENDLAIADGGTHYMAPLRARIIAGDLSLLPLWYAGTEDYILVPDAACRREGERLAARYGLVSRFLLPEDVGRYDISGFVTWGWSPEIVRRLSRWGADVSRLPSAAQLSRLKELSHRACTVDILRALPRYGYTGIPEYLPVQLTSPDEVRRF